MLGPTQPAILLDNTLLIYGSGGSRLKCFSDNIVLVARRMCSTRLRLDSAEQIVDLHAGRVNVVNNDVVVT